MNNTYQFLHLACKIHASYETMRSSLLDASEYAKLINTYHTQRYYFPDSNTPAFWDAKFSEAYSNHPMAEFRERLVVNNTISSKNLLNIGVGRGNLESILFNKFGPKLAYCGTDITPKSVHRLQNKFPTWKFLLSKPFSLPFSNKEFDQVFLLEVLEHIKPNKTFKLLNEIFRVCNDNAKFIVSIPINEGLIEMLPDNPNSHMRVYTERLVCFELDIAGFEVTHIYRLTAFNNFFTLKSFINNLFHFRKPNNLVIICRKR